LLKQSWIKRKAVLVSPELIASKHSRARVSAVAAAKTWFCTDGYDPNDDLPLDSVDAVRHPCFYTDRKSAIRFLHFHIVTAPDTEDWYAMSLILMACLASSTALSA
jgi:hypothetical protein